MHVHVTAGILHIMIILHILHYNYAPTIPYLLSLFVFFVSLIKP